MHTQDIKIPDVGRLLVHHNSDWSGEARVIFQTPDDEDGRHSLAEIVNQAIDDATYEGKLGRRSVSVEPRAHRVFGGDEWTTVWYAVEDDKMTPLNFWAVIR